MRTGGDGMDADVINIHVIGNVLRNTEGNILALTRIKGSVHLKQFPSGGSGRRDVRTNLHKGVGIIRITHHTHLNVIVGGSLVGPEAHLKVVHLYGIIQARGHQIGMVSTGAVEIDRVGSRMAVRRGRVRICRTCVIRKARPAGNHIARTGSGGCFEVFRQRNVLRHTRRVRTHHRPRTIVATAAIRTQADEIVHVRCQVIQRVWSCHRTFLGPCGAIGAVLHLPGRLTVSRNPVHRRTRCRNTRNVCVRLNTCGRQVTFGHKTHIVAVITPRSGRWRRLRIGIGAGIIII